MTQRRPISPARSEADGIEDMRAFIGHTAWKAAATIHVEVDQLADQLMVSCYRDIPDIEIDPSPALSVGFHQYREEYLLTSLCLYGVSCWPEPHAKPESQTNDMAVARSLIGESASIAVAGLLGGGSGAVTLPTREVAELTHRALTAATLSTQQQLDQVEDQANQLVTLHAFISSG
jgi:hypothetical protein